MLLQNDYVFYGSTWRRNLILSAIKPVILNVVKDLRCFAFAQHDTSTSFWVQRRILDVSLTLNMTMCRHSECNEESLYFLRCFAIAQHDGDTVILSATKDLRCFAFAQHDGDTVILSVTKDLRCFALLNMTNWRHSERSEESLYTFKMFRYAQHDDSTSKIRFLIFFQKRNDHLKYLNCCLQKQEWISYLILITSL